MDGEPPQGCVAIEDIRASHVELGAANFVFFAEQTGLHPLERDAADHAIEALLPSSLATSTAGSTPNLGLCEPAAEAIRLEDGVH